LAAAELRAVGAKRAGEGKGVTVEWMLATLKSCGT
jgi:hypothetical protein